MKKNEITPPDWSELNRAAGAGYGLAEARRSFDTSAAKTMLEFTEADHALRQTQFHTTHPTVYTCFDASHTAYAHFITVTRFHWLLEDDEEDKPPSPHKKRTRTEDIHDGLLDDSFEKKPVDEIIHECARIEFDHDRNISKQLLYIGLGWKDDLNHCRDTPDWAKTQGIFPGAETAPALAGMMSRIATSLVSINPAQVAALQLAAHAAAHLRESANAFGRACCAEYEYNRAFNTDSTLDYENR